MSNNEDYLKAVHLVLTERRAGAAFLKQKLLLSDSKVARLLKDMEKNGVVSKVLPGGARNVLLDPPPPIETENANAERVENKHWTLDDLEIADDQGEQE